MRPPGTETDRPSNTGVSSGHEKDRDDTTMNASDMGVRPRECAARGTTTRVEKRGRRNGHQLSMAWHIQGSP
ncbi:hypothetical protein GCM10011609_22840 [Lentzea pudingi]|uniref:Uncharacterized protein n=1 Tax=Lentzea pudingi TaxID=1789439 RepID=A0ABQ2HM57_9PSEU|nr:hypothetical protein GCM10011609_22840 [Lentzea pudingi]